MARCIINGVECEFTKGETILQIASRNNIYIPTLCYLKNSMPTGKCNICSVEIDGKEDLVRACVTEAEDGMIIYTESDRCKEYRKEILEKLLAKGYHDCPTCPIPGNCELQELVFRYNAKGIDLTKTKRKFEVKYLTPFIRWDPSKCVRCGRCVQACYDIQVNNAITLYELDGKERKIKIDGKEYTLAESKEIIDKIKDEMDSPVLPAPDNDFCVSCGECVQACPVGALSSKYEWIGPKKWGMKKVRTTCAFCGVGCQIYLYVKDNKVKLVTGVEDSPPNYGSLCVKGRFGFDFLNSPDRLKRPLIKKDGEFKEVSWDEALDYVANRLEDIKRRYGPDSIGVFASARITNEENYVLQKFTRAVLGTNNIDHCARL